MVSLDSSALSDSARPLMTFCRRNFLMWDVATTSVTSLSFSHPSLGGLLAWTWSTSFGGKLIGLPSNLRTCKEPMSARA